MAIKHGYRVSKSLAKQVQDKFNELDAYLKANNLSIIMLSGNDEMILIPSTKYDWADYQSTRVAIDTKHGPYWFDDEGSIEKFFSIPNMPNIIGTNYEGNGLCAYNVNHAPVKRDFTFKPIGFAEHLCEHRHYVANALANISDLLASKRCVLCISYNDGSRSILPPNVIPTGVGDVSWDSIKDAEISVPVMDYMGDYWALDVTLS